VPSVDFTDDEHAAVTGAVRHAITDGRYPPSPRLDPLKSALAKLDPASVPRTVEPKPALPAGPARSRGGRRAVIGRAQLFRNSAVPETWRVERENEDGSIEVAIFHGPDARERATRYADRQYGDFAEVSYPPYE
jgi:hypothetical protein